MKIYRISNEEIAYHASFTPPDIILKEGLSKKSTGHTVFDAIEDIERFLPTNRIYVAKTLGQYEGEYHYKIDISGLKKYPDFGAFPDFGAYMDYDQCWWKDRDINRISDVELKSYVTRNNGELAYEDIIGEDTWDFFGTCVLEGPIPPDRMKFMNKNI